MKAERKADKTRQPTVQTVLPAPNFFGNQILVAVVFFAVATLWMFAWWDRSPVILKLFQEYWTRDRGLLVPAWPGVAVVWLANSRAIGILAAIEAASFLLGRCALVWALGGARGPGRLWNALLSIGLGNGLLGTITLGLGLVGLLTPTVFWTGLVASLVLARNSVRQSRTFASFAGDPRRWRVPAPEPDGPGAPGPVPAGSSTTPLSPAGSAYPCRWVALADRALLVLCVAIAFVCLAGLAIGLALLLKKGPLSTGLFIDSSLAMLPAFACACAAAVAGCALFGWATKGSNTGARWTTGLLAGFCAFVLAYGLLPALTPEWFYDSLVYHLAVPEQYLIRHKIHYLGHTFISNYPLLQEMRYLFCLTLGDDISPKLIHWADGILSAAAAFALARAFIGPVAGWLAAALFLSTPTLYVLQQITMVELGLTWFLALTTMAFVAAMGWVPSADKVGVRPASLGAVASEAGAGRALLATSAGKAGTRAPRLAWLLLVGWFLGYAQGVKYIGLNASVLILGWLVLELGRARVPWRRILFASALIIGWASLWTGVWLGKNWAFTGNPLFPFFHNLMPGLNWDSACQNLWMTDNTKYGTGQGSLSNWLTLPAFVSVMAKDFGTFTLNPFAIILLPLLLLYRNPPAPIRFLAMYATLFTVLWATSSQQVRFLVPMVPQAAVAASFVVARFGENTWMIRASLVAVAAWTLIGSANGLARQRYTSNVLLAYNTGHVSRDSGLRNGVQYYEAVQRANAVMGPRDRLLFVGNDESFYCARPRICDSIYDHSTLGGLAERANSPADLARRLKRLRVTHILVNERRCEEYEPYGLFRWSDRARDNFIGMWAAYLSPIFNARNVQVFELADRPAPANLRKTGMPPYLYPSATMKEAAAWGANFDRCIGTGAFSDALKATSEMVRLTPKAAQAYAFRGFVHGRLNEVAEAERDYQTAIRMGYPPAFVHVYLGTYQSNRRAYREALDNLLRGIALDPAIAPVARAQALVPALGLKKYDVALSLAEALLAANPSDPALKDQVARIRQLAAGTAKK